MCPLPYRKSRKISKKSENPLIVLPALLPTYVRRSWRVRCPAALQGPSVTICHYSQPEPAWTRPGWSISRPEIRCNEFRNPTAPSPYTNAKACFLYRRESVAARVTRRRTHTTSLHIPHRIISSCTTNVRKTVPGSTGPPQARHTSRPHYMAPRHAPHGPRAAHIRMPHERGVSIAPWVVP